jgi:O-antigen ligase
MRQSSHIRPWLLVITSVAVALLCVSVLLVSWRARRAPSGTGGAPSVYAELPPAWKLPSPSEPRLPATVGVNLDASELSGERLGKTLDELQQSGIIWLRFTLAWDQMEPMPRQYDWNWADRVFAALAERPRLQPLVVLNGSPAWARASEDADNPLAPPHQRSDLGAFASEVARRYGTQLRYYQVWQEPNIAPHWGARSVDPADYLGLLREVAVQIRAADPDAVIVAAGLAPTTEAGGENLSDIAYLDALYQLGGREWFDIVAAEPFGFSDAPSAPPNSDRLSFRRAELLRQVMTRHGDFTAPLWAVSYGWNALPKDWTGAASPWGQVSEGQQAQYADGALDIASSGLPWEGPLFWAALCPERPSGDPWVGFSLCSTDGSPRPVWGVLAERGRQPPVLPPGDHPVNHPALRYSAGWRVKPSAADPSADGDSLVFRFNGTGLALRVQGGPYWALYRAWVDGQPANALPRDGSGAAYLVLYDPTAEVRVVPIAQDLPLGEHEVRLVATGGWGQWALRGVLVLAAVQPLSSRLLIWALLALTGAGLALWTVLAWPWRRAMAEWLSSRLDRIAAGPAILLWVAAVALILLLALSHWLFLDLVVLAGLGILFLIQPDLSLPLIAATIPLSPHPKVLARWEFSLYEIVLWLAVAATAARWIVTRLNDQRTAPVAPGSRGIVRRAWPAVHGAVRGLDWPVLALMAAGLAATLAAGRRDVAVREFRTVFLGGALFYWVITRVPRLHGRPFSPWPLLNGLTLGGLLVSSLALWQLVSGQGRVAVEGVWRVRALYGSPNNLALYLDRLVPLTLAVAAFGIGMGRAKWQRLFYGASALIMTIACVATFSKGALLLGLPVGVGLVLTGGAWRRRQRWPLGLLVAFLLVTAVGLVFMMRTPRFAGLFNLESGTSALRLKLWLGAWHMVLDHPWLGVGPDNFLYAYRTRYVLPDAWQELNLSHPHNIVLDLWTRLGLAGLAAGGWAVIAGAWAGWRLFKRASDELWPAILGLLGGLGAAVAHGLIDNSLFLVDLMALFMLTLGVFQCLGERSRA